MVAAVCVPARHDPALAPRARLADPVARDPVAQAVAPVAARVQVVLAGGPRVGGPVAMARAVAEVAHTAAVMAMAQRQPRHARRPSPSSRVVRSRFRRRLSSKTWRKCSTSRSMK